MKSRAPGALHTVRINSHGPFMIDGMSLTTEGITRFVRDSSATLRVSRTALTRMEKTRAVLERELIKRPIYGVNTGFGPMVTRIIDKKAHRALQYNLIRGHAVGVGTPLADEDVLAAMIVRLNTLAKGASCATPALARTLQEFINARIIPVVPEHGAVGTSGDLVQLAHIALALIGEGIARHNGAPHPVPSILAALRIKPHQLGPKEGLSLINGTAMMSGIASLLITDARRAIDVGIRLGACALELVRGFGDVLDAELHALRPHRGQLSVAARTRELLADSGLISDREQLHNKISIRSKTYTTNILLQEVYSLRCTPQIIGPMHDTVETAAVTVNTEINSVTDNPIISADRSRFIHGGNFHGDYIAVAVDQLKLAMAKLGMLSERRINFFLNPKLNTGFPPFLNLGVPGLTMGLQGMQFVATSTAAQNQSLAFPHSIHSIPTNGDNQDVVSMGTDAALFAKKVLDNVFVLLALELVTLAQAFETLTRAEQRKASRAARSLIAFARTHIAPVRDDRTLTSEIAALVHALRYEEKIV